MAAKTSLNQVEIERGTIPIFKAENTYREMRGSRRSSQIAEVRNPRR